MIERKCGENQMFLKKKKPQQRITTYNSDRYTPVLHCSICTGEQTAGFRDNTTGTFHEIMLIRDEKDLQEFKDVYGVENLKKEY